MNEYLPSSVLQMWAQELPFMQQTVLITAVRGPDTLEKHHPAKTLLRWYRRCILYSAFESYKAGVPIALTDPYTLGGGSFTGPCLPNVHGSMEEVIGLYLKATDEIPHHFHLHLLHAIEILGYKHPIKFIREYWFDAYLKFVKDMHLNPESLDQMESRLGSPKGWLEASNPHEKEGISS